MEAIVIQADLPDESLPKESVGPDLESGKAHLGLLQQGIEEVDGDHIAPSKLVVPSQDRLCHGYHFPLVVEDRPSAVPRDEMEVGL